MRKLKDFLHIKQMPLLLGFIGYIVLLHFIFQNTFNAGYILFTILGMVAVLVIAVAQLLPHEFGAVWVKVSLSRKQLLDIRNQGHAVPGINIVGHFRNSTEFYNFCYSPLDQYTDVYVKVPVYNYCFARFDYGVTGIFLWDVEVKKMIMDALRLALRNEEPDPENRIDVMVSPTSLELVKSYPIEVVYCKVPEDYYGWRQSALRIIFTIAAQIPIWSFADIWDMCKEKVGSWIK
jgi:hypothetical protein